MRNNFPIKDLDFFGEIQTFLRRKKIAVWIALFFLSSLSFFGLHEIKMSQETINIAINVPRPGAYASDAEEMIRGSQMYVDQINQSGGIHHKKVKLIVYDSNDDQNLQNGITTAEEIAKGKALAVVGGYFSSIMIPSTKIYKQQGIPSITGIAAADDVTLNNEWSFRVISNASFRGEFIGRYIYHVMGAEKISVVYNSDENFSKGIRNSFNKAYQEASGIVNKEWDINVTATKENPDEKAAQIAKEILAEKPDLVFLALQPQGITKLLSLLRRKGYTSPIFIAASAWNLNTLKSEPDEFQKKGFLSNNTYATSQLIYDIANESAQEFRRFYLNKYNSEPLWITAISYDEMKVAIAAIKQANITGDPKKLKLERSKIREALSKFSTTETSVDGLTGKIYFNRDRNTETPPNVGFYQDRQFISAFEQLYRDNTNYQNNPKKFEELIQNKQIILVSNVPMKAANIVYTGIDVNEVRNIDQKISSYMIDFYLWFRYHNENKFDPSNIEFTNYDPSQVKSSEKMTLNKPILEKEKDGVITKSYRMRGVFQEPFDFYEYPFDKQRLAIRFRHSDLTRDNLIYVVDFLGMRDTKPEKTVENWKKNDVFGTISDWELLSVNFYQDTLRNLSGLGQIQQTDDNESLEYSRFNAVISIGRNRVSFILKNLLPLFFFVLVAYILMFLPFEEIKVTGISSLLLAVVFFHLNLLNKLPERVGYTVALDYGFYIIYVLLGLQMLLIVIGYNEKISKNPVLMKRLLITGRVLYPIAICLAVVFFRYRYW